MKIFGEFQKKNNSISYQMRIWSDKIFNFFDILFQSSPVTESVSKEAWNEVAKKAFA